MVGKHIRSLTRHLTKQALIYCSFLQNYQTLELVYRKLSFYVHLYV